MSGAPDELRDLIDEYLSGEMEETRFARLQSWLATDSHARDYFVRYAQIHFQLFVDMRADRAADRVLDRIRGVRDEAEVTIQADVAALQAEADSIADESRSSNPATDTRPQPSTKSVLGFLGDVSRRSWTLLANHALLLSGLATLAATAVVAVLVLRNPGPDQGNRLAGQGGNSPVVQSSHPDSNAPVAKFVREKDCRWDGDAAKLKVGSNVPTGETLRLSSGVAEIQFEIGAKVIVQSPATLQLVSASSMRLDVGKATVEIKDERARGFKILTPEANFVDQGTEFGVEVAPGGGSKIHVFRGVVDVDRKSPGGRPAPLTQRLMGGVGARMEPGDEGMTTVEDTGECFIRSMSDADRDLHTVAYWRFEDRPLGAALPNTNQNRNPTRATIDSTFNGNDLFDYNPGIQARISGDVAAGIVPQTGVANHGCLDTSISVKRVHADLYTKSRFSHAAPLDVQDISPEQWTIEVSVKAKQTDGIRTFVGRDGSDKASAKESGWIPPRMAFQINEHDRFAIRFVDCDHRQHEAVADDLPVQAGRWYHLAAVSDSRTLRMYVDCGDGGGYQLRAETPLPKTGSVALDKGSGDAEWSIGRGRDQADGTPGQWFDGWIDEVRISDVPLNRSEFLFSGKQQ